MKRFLKALEATGLRARIEIVPDRVIVFVPANTTSECELESVVAKDIVL